MENKVINVHQDIFLTQVLRARLAFVQNRSTSNLIAKSSFGFDDESLLIISKAIQKKISLESSIASVRAKKGRVILNCDECRSLFVNNLKMQLLHAA